MTFQLETQSLGKNNTFPRIGNNCDSFCLKMLMEFCSILPKVWYVVFSNSCHFLICIICIMSRDKDVLKYLNEFRVKSHQPLWFPPHVFPSLLLDFSCMFSGLQGLLWGLYLNAGDHQHRLTAPYGCVGPVPLPQENALWPQCRLFQMAFPRGIWELDYRRMSSVSPGTGDGSLVQARGPVAGRAGGS